MTEGPHRASESEPPEGGIVDPASADRPLPSVHFRRSLGRYLVENDPGYGPRPASLRLAVAASLAAGCGLIAIGALQAVGAL